MLGEANCLRNPGPLAFIESDNDQARNLVAKHPRCTNAFETGIRRPSHTRGQLGQPATPRTPRMSRKWPTVFALLRRSGAGQAAIGRLRAAALCCARSTLSVG